MIIQKKDWYQLRDNLGKLLSHSCQMMIEHGKSTPMDMEEEEWNCILGQIKAAADILAKDKVSEEDIPVVEKGMQLVATHIFDLWD